MAGQIQVFYDEVDYRINNVEEVVSWLKSVVEKEQKDVGELSIIFVSDERLLEINKDFLKHDYYTDIITFDYAEGEKISGELYISIDRVVENASGAQRVENERDRVSVHGILHLLGYKDKEASDVAEMRSKEDYYLNLRPYVSRET